MLLAGIKERQGKSEEWGTSQSLWTTVLYDHAWNFPLQEITNLSKIHVVAYFHTWKFSYKNNCFDNGKEGLLWITATVADGLLLKLRRSNYTRMFIIL